VSKPLFGYGGELHPRKGRATISRDQGGHEKWSEALLPADAGAGKLETPTTRRPILVMALMAVGLFCVLASQLFRLQLIDGERNLGLADGNRLRQKENRAPRGIIYDRTKKVMLAENLATFDVTVTPSLLPRDEKSRNAVYAKVSQMIGKPVSEIAAKAEGDCTSHQPKLYSQSQARAVCLGSSQAEVVATNVSRDQALNLDQSTAELPGFSLDTNQIRNYKDNGMLSAILGYTGRVSSDDIGPSSPYLPTDFVGKLGIERQYEDVLRGQNGSEQTEVDASGRPIKVLGSKPSYPGSNLVLSIDMGIESKLADSIKAQMQASGANQAAGVALNPKTGEILAAVNLPTYDNNLFAKGISVKDYENLTNDPGQPLFNKVMAGGYPSGSIIKPLIASAALQEHAITPDTTVNDTGALEIPNQYDPKVKYTFRSYEPGGLGVVNVTKAIALSSNVFFYTVGGGYGNIAGLGVDKLVSYYHKFGLGQKTGVDVPGEGNGRIPTPAWKKQFSGQPWYLGDTYNISVGQGDLLASPLQMAVATAAVANRGSVIEPHVVKAIDDPNGGETVIPTKVKQKNFISPENNELVRNAMRQVVTSGTACCLIEKQVPVPVAGKTGTAETDPEGKKKPDAWFTAFAPFDDPQIVIVVLIPNSGEGAQYAAPAVRETLAYCFNRPGGCVQ
jgi:penicillin-binding protein 2